MKVHTLMCWYESHVTIFRFSAKTIPASSAPPKRMPSARPSR